MIEGLDLALETARLADEKQAEDIQIIDLRGISTITDFFVICSGTSMPHLKAIRKEIRETLKNDRDISPSFADGDPESQWLVLDYIDVMVHIFHHSQRDHYALEELWSDAPQLDWEKELATSGSAA